MTVMGRGVFVVVGALMLAGWQGLGAPSAQAAANCQEARVADAAGAAFLNAAKQGSVAAFASALDTYADMDQITLFALGKYRSQLPARRRAELTNLTSRYVSSTLAGFAAKFRGTGIRAIECRRGQVISRFSRGARGAERVTWRFNGNKVTDVHIQNVWLGQVLRQNFSDIISKGGGSIDALFHHLGAKTSSEMGNR